MFWGVDVDLNHPKQLASGDEMLDLFFCNLSFLAGLSTRADWSEGLAFLNSPIHTL